MLNAFTNYIENQAAFLKKSNLLIALSGGLDSVVLTHLCHGLNLNVALAHCNFNLRGDESNEDEQFVIQLAEQLDLEVFVEYFDTENYAKNHKMSIQMAARELRYNWFKELAEQLNFDFILTAHHADDNLETFLINLSRGGGLEGLTGIPERNEKILRPLLSFSRDDLKQFATDNNIKWREDSSNVSTKYVRNKIRLEVIPKLKDLNPHFLENFKTTIEHLNEASVIIGDRMNVVSDDVLEVNEDYISLNIDKLKTLSNPKAYLFELLKSYGFTEWNDVEDLLEAQSGKQLISKDWRLLKDRDLLILTAKNTSSIDKISIDKFDKEVTFPSGALFLDEADSVSETVSSIIFVDKEKLQWPLIIRKWEEGDSFYPFGLNGRKKISKYFKDEKMSLFDKEKTWLLYSGNDIIWVIGRRADERFKVTDDTKHILKIELK